MTTHSSILAWKIPWTEKPGGLLSMGSQKKGISFIISSQESSLFLLVLKSGKSKIKSPIDSVSGENSPPGS